MTYGKRQFIFPILKHKKTGIRKLGKPIPIRTRAAFRTRRFRRSYGRPFRKFGRSFRRTRFVPRRFPRRTGIRRFRRSWGAKSMARKALYSGARFRRFVRTGFRKRPIYKWYKRTVVSYGKGLSVDVLVGAWKFPFESGNTTTQGWEAEWDNIDFWNYPCAILQHGFVYNDFINFTRVQSHAQTTQGPGASAENNSYGINRREHSVFIHNCYVNISINYHPSCLRPYGTGDNGTTWALEEVASNMIVEVTLWKKKEVVSTQNYAYIAPNDGTPDLPMLASDTPSPFPNRDASWMANRTRYAYINPFNLGSGRLKDQHQWKILRKRNLHFYTTNQPLLNYRDIGAPAHADPIIQPYSGNFKTKYVKFFLYKNTRLRLPTAILASDITAQGTWNTFGRLNPILLSQRYYISYRVCRPMIQGKTWMHTLWANVSANNVGQFGSAYLPSITESVHCTHQADF